MEIGSGTTINITIPLDKAITEYDNIFISLYTNAAYPVRFSYLTKTGFNKLNVGNTSSQLIGVLTAAQSAKISGDLYMEMRAIDETTPDENIGNSIPTLVVDANGEAVTFINNTLKSTI
jgi:hypothetical protein